MRIVLPQAMFGAGGAGVIELDDLVRAVLNYEHVLLLDPPWDPGEGGAVARWLDQREPDYADAWRLVLDAGSDEASESVLGSLEFRIVQGRPSNWATRELTLLDASGLLRTPLRLYLEDRRSDYAFLRRIASRGQRDGLDRARASARMQIDHGGGNTSMRAALERLRASRREPQPDQHRLAWVESYRLWVLFDKDAFKHHKDAIQDDATTESSESKALRKECEKLDVPHHQTGRRSIENYLPDEALRRWVNQGFGRELTKRRARCRAFCDAFGPQHRAAFPMKAGLQKDRRDGHLPPPFRDLVPAVAEVLEHGFGDDIAESFDVSELSDSAFQRVFEHDPDARDWRKKLFSTLFGRL